VIKRFTRLAAVALALASVNAFGYPEMIRHGYVNCTSCHVSPNGGGILNAYGRVQAEEVLSTWSREGEGGLLHGAVPSQLGPVSFGGQFRALQLWQQSYGAAGAASGRFILMQADVEASAKFGQFEFVATGGVQDVKGIKPLSRRHYAIFRPTEDSPWMIRAGRFVPAFGINVADHAIATKAGIGLGQGIESYNVEGSWLGEKFDVFLTANFGRPGEDREKGFAARAGYNLGERSKVGVSYSLGTNTLGTRQLFGPYAMVGFTEHFFLLAELDFQNLSRASGTTFGPASYARLNYEFFKGVHLYLTGEYAQTNSASPTHYAGGLGAQFFPRPHFELRAEYTRRLDDYTAELAADYAWLMMHYYL
jgi:hypothetical protein